MGGNLARIREINYELEYGRPKCGHHNFSKSSPKKGGRKMRWFYLDSYLELVLFLFPLTHSLSFLISTTHYHYKTTITGNSGGCQKVSSSPSWLQWKVVRPSGLLLHAYNNKKINFFVLLSMLLVWRFYTC